MTGKRSGLSRWMVVGALVLVLAGGLVEDTAAQTPSGIGPRVEEPALLLINPYPWSAPLEEVRLKPQ